MAKHRPLPDQLRVAAHFNVSSASSKGLHSNSGQARAQLGHRHMT
jgi:hypothetical protein